MSVAAQSAYPEIIGIAGIAGAGKDTIGFILEKNYGFSPIAFADTVRQIAAIVASMPLRDYKKLPKEKVIQSLGITRRHLEQSLGTDWARDNVDTDIWLNKCKLILRCLKSAGAQRVVITDVQFENEAAFVREYGNLIHIEGGFDAADAAATRQHKSEDGIKSFPNEVTIYNNFDLSHLLQTVSLSMKQLDYQPKF